MIAVLDSKIHCARCYRDAVRYKRLSPSRLECPCGSATITSVDANGREFGKVSLRNGWWRHLLWFLHHPGGIRLPKAKAVRVYEP